MKLRSYLAFKKEEFTKCPPEKTQLKKLKSVIDQDPQEDHQIKEEIGTGHGLMIVATRRRVKGGVIAR